MFELNENFVTSGYQGSVKSRPRGMPPFACFGGGGGGSMKETEEEKEAKRAASDKYARSIIFDQIGNKQRQGFDKYGVTERTAAILGASNADIAQAEDENFNMVKESLRMSGAAPGSFRAYHTNAAVRSDANDAKLEAFAKGSAGARDEMDGRWMNVVKEGAKLSQDIGVGLREKASLAASDAAAKLKSKMANRSANVQAFSQIGGFAASGGIGSGLKKPTPGAGAPGTPAFGGGYDTPQSSPYSLRDFSAHS